MSAIAYCHERRIVHRDIKPENIVFNNESEDAEIKVIDFGTSRYFDKDQKMTKRLGTVIFL